MVSNSYQKCMLTKASPLALSSVQIRLPVVSLVNWISFVIAFIDQIRQLNMRAWLWIHRCREVEIIIISNRRSAGALPVPVAVNQVKNRHSVRGRRSKDRMGQWPSKTRGRPKHHQITQTDRNIGQWASAQQVMWHSNSTGGACLTHTWRSKQYYEQRRTGFEPSGLIWCSLSNIPDCFIWRYHHRLAMTGSCEFSKSIRPV
jgi:hypothetical protein